MMKTMKTKKTFMRCFMQCMMLLMVAMASMTALTACHKDDEVEAPEPAPQPAKPTTYTIMLYGCGGGNLDEYLDYNLNQLDAHGKTDRVNFTALVKFSACYQSEVATQGTRRFTLTSEGLKNEKTFDTNYRLDNPAHLTQFIKDSQEKMPADKYILIFWNHGQEFGLNDELPETKDYTEGTDSRSILFDDNTDDASLSVYEIEKGIKDAGLKMDLIYMDLCNYGMAEVYYQLKDCARYMMATPAPTPCVSGNYAELLEDLQKNDSLTDAIKEYVPNCMKYWKTANDEVEDEYLQMDLECYDLSYMDEFASYLKGAMGEFSDLVDKTAEDQKLNYDPLFKGYVLPKDFGLYTGSTDTLHVFSGNGYSVDVCSAFTRIAGHTVNGKMSYYATMMQRVLDKMTVARASYKTPEWMHDVSMGIAWPTNSMLFFIRDASHQYNLDENLDYAALYKATGWGDIIRKIPKSYAYESPLNGSPIYVKERYQYRYPWKFDIEVDPSGLDEDQQEELQQLIDTKTSYLNDLIEDKPFFLSLSPYAINEALEYLYHSNSRFSFMNKLLGLNKEKFKIKLSSTIEIGSYDECKDLFPAMQEREVDIKEYIQNYAH